MSATQIIVGLCALIFILGCLAGMIDSAADPLLDNTRDDPRV